jgi:O-antigen biosynthesis protein
MSDTAVPILLYHSVATEGAAAYYRWMVSPERFRRQMAFLARNGYQAITASALAAYRTLGEPLPAKPVLITFDDGLRDFASGALPVLRHFGFPAALFVATDYVGRTSRWLESLGEGNRPMLSWSELVELQEQGVECGAHTCSHPQLDVLSRSVAKFEIATSKAVLEEALGRPVRTFAYPHGYASSAVRRLVRDAGFSLAFGVRNRPSSMRQDNFALSRITITEAVDDQRMGELLAEPSSTVDLALDRVVAFGWRLVRRLEHRLRKTA